MQYTLSPDIVKENCKFTFYFNKTAPTVVDRDNKIILANWPDGRHTICNINNDIPVKISSHPYVLVNTSILWDCSIEAENIFLNLWLLVIIQI